MTAPPAGSGEGDYPALLERLTLPPQAVRPLAAYLELLDVWSSRVNLTGARSAEERVGLLVRDVAPLGSALRPGTLLDVGSGNGSPGLVLAVLRPELRAVLLEPRHRRWAFLREAARAMGRPDIDVLRQRHDQYTGRPARNVVVRALALPLPELGALVEPGGQLLVLGRPSSGDRGPLGEPQELRSGAWRFERA